MDLQFLTRNTRTAKRTSYMQRRRGVTFAGSKIWDHTEDETVIQTAHEGVAATQKLLPHRTCKAIERRRQKLGASKRTLKPWTTLEDRILKTNIELGYPAIAKLLPGRTAHSVQGRAWYLGIRKGRLRPAKAKGLPVYDMVRSRAYEDGMSMHALDRELGTGKYFQDNHQKKSNWKKLARAVEYFGGEMTVDWRDC
jgi:hypothetical protein